MNGPEHYKSAEQLLSKALHLRSETDSTPLDPGAAHLVACAQVHATLALAAATADVAHSASTDDDNGLHIFEAWRAAGAIG